MRRISASSKAAAAIAALPLREIRQPTHDPALCFHNASHRFDIHTILVVPIKSPVNSAHAKTGNTLISVDDANGVKVGWLLQTGDNLSNQFPVLLLNGHAVWLQFSMGCGSLINVEFDAAATYFSGTGCSGTYRFRIPTDMDINRGATSGVPVAACQPLENATGPDLGSFSYQSILSWTPQLNRRSCTDVAGALSSSYQRSEFSLAAPLSLSAE